MGAGALMLSAYPVAAITFDEPAPRFHWECVPYARAISGIQIYGDAYTWWNQAEGRYRRGNVPKIGAVLAFIPHGRMQLGHVATVSEIVNDRTIRVTHANWSPINGRRGQVERNVLVIDASENNDWSAVRVWFAPNENLGGTAWPVHGFIYPGDGAPVIQPKPAKLPKLQYAAVLNWSAKTSRPVQMASAEPTGRLSYLGKVLPELK